MEIREGGRGRREIGRKRKFQDANLGFTEGKPGLGLAENEIQSRAVGRLAGVLHNASRKGFGKKRREMEGRESES